VYQYKISRGKPGSIDTEVSNIGECQLASSPWGVGRAYRHMLHLIYLTASKKKLQTVLNFGQNLSWKLLKIIPADLLDTLIYAFEWHQHQF